MISPGASAEFFAVLASTISSVDANSENLSAAELLRRLDSRCQAVSERQGTSELVAHEVLDLARRFVRQSR